MLNPSAEKILNHLSNIFGFEFVENESRVTFTRDNIEHDICYTEDGEISSYSRSDGYFMERYSNTLGGVTVLVTESDNKNYIREYDENKNLVHYKDSTGYEYYDKFDSNGNLISHKKIEVKE